MQKFLLLLMAVVLVGCGTPAGYDVHTNNANMAKLSIGMTKEQILDVMGAAARTESYKSKSGGVMEYLFYRTNIPLKPDSSWTPICIIDGKLEGWGRNFYDDTIKIRKEIIKN